MEALVVKDETLYYVAVSRSTPRDIPLLRFSARRKKLAFTLQSKT